jgi:hypothetical protein
MLAQVLKGRPPSGPPRCLQRFEFNLSPYHFFGDNGRRMFEACCPAVASEAEETESRRTPWQHGHQGPCGLKAIPNMAEPSSAGKCVSGLSQFMSERPLFVTFAEGLKCSYVNFVFERKDSERTKKLPVLL